MLARLGVCLIVLAACTESGSSGTRCAVDNADTSVNTATIEGRYLHLDVSFGGGCEEHDFEVAWSGMVGASQPPVTAVELLHDGHGDACDAWITDDLFFDLSLMDATLLQGGGGPVRVSLRGYANELVYSPGEPDAPPNATVQLLQYACGAE